MDGFLVDTLSDTFTASAVPLPGTLWLLESDLFGLFSLTRKTIVRYRYNTRDAPDTVLCGHQPDQSPDKSLEGQHLAHGEEFTIDLDGVMIKAVGSLVSSNIRIT